MASKFYNLSTDTTLGGDNPSDYTAPSEKAIKTYVDNNSGRVSSVNNVSPDEYGDVSLSASDVGAQPAGNYVTIDTKQTITVAKAVFGTDVAFGSDQTQKNLFAVVSNNNSQNGVWTGRLTVGAKNRTFILGTYGNKCILGAHSWSNAQQGTGAAWEDVYINPDGDKAVYVGGSPVNGRQALFKVTNVNYTTAGKVQVNRVTNLLQSNWKDVACWDDNVSKFNNDAGYITEISSSDVTTALGYTPYDSTNPNGYTSNVGTVTSVNNVQPVDGNVSLTIPTVNVDDVQINGTSILSSKVANIITNSAYNASSNKIATMTDLSGKMDTDLSNMSASQTAKNTIVGWGFPDYSAGVAKATGTTFTVTSYCLLEVRATYAGGGSQGVTVKINDKSFDPTTPGYTSNYSYYSLSPNDEVLVTYNIANNTTCTVTVYPLKGVS